MDERLKFVSRLLDGEKMAVLCRRFGVSRKTGYKMLNRYNSCGVEGGLTDRSRRPYRPPARAFCSPCKRPNCVTHVTGMNCHPSLRKGKPALPRSVNAPGVTSRVTAPTSLTPFGEAPRVFPAARGI